MNRQDNTRLRTYNFKNVPQHLQNHMIELERDYGKYCYLPLAIPIIFDDKIVDWFFEHMKAVVKMKPDIADKRVGFSAFNGINVFFDEKYFSNNSIWSYNPYPTFKQDFPHFYQQLMDFIPMAQIPRLTFWNSTDMIHPHRDHSYLFDMPSGIRTMLYDENPVDTLYVFEETESYRGHKKYVSKMEDTNSFAWNNLRVMHGSDYDPKYAKILLIINDFIPDYKKYRLVMDKSISRYSSELLTSNNRLSDFVTETEFYS